MANQKVYIYADFDWFPKEQLVGALSYERLRGTDSYAFSFDKAWLREHGEMVLSDDLQNYPGMQYTLDGRDIFGCFSDALPDRWGRTLLLRREQLEAREQQRPARHLSSFDFLLGIDDASRMGGFRLKLAPDGEFINTQTRFRIPPVTDLRELVRASEEIERSEENDTLPDKQWIEQLLMPGTSLGGARPKANVADNGTLHVAKFPSRKDHYDVAAWEHFAHLLASRAGICCAETRLLQTGGKYQTLLSKRFDRNEQGRRIHFASAMTLLGLADGNNASTGNGYLDIVDFIIRGCTDVERNLHELYRRVAYNICIGNSDDHFRNHGFLLTRKGWTLSPAYDMNPTLNDCQSLLINNDTNEASLSILLDSAEDYMITKVEASKIIEGVVAAVAGWRQIAHQLQLSARDINAIAPKFDKAWLS